MTGLKALRWLDFAAAAASLAYGIATASVFWSIGGALGLLLAVLNPGRRIAAWMLGIKRGSGVTRAL